MPKVELSDRFIATLKPQALRALDYFEHESEGAELACDADRCQGVVSDVHVPPRWQACPPLPWVLIPLHLSRRPVALAIEARGHAEAGVHSCAHSTSLPVPDP